MEFHVYYKNIQNCPLKIILHLSIRLHSLLLGIYQLQDFSGQRVVQNQQPIYKVTQLLQGYFLQSQHSSVFFFQIDFVQKFKANLEFLTSLIAEELPTSNHRENDTTSLKIQGLHTIFTDESFPAYLSFNQLIYHLVPRIGMRPFLRSIFRLEGDESLGDKSVYLL